MTYLERRRRRISEANVILSVKAAPLKRRLSSVSVQQTFLVHVWLTRLAATLSFVERNLVTAYTSSGELTAVPGSIRAGVVLVRSMTRMALRWLSTSDVNRHVQLKFRASTRDRVTSGQFPNRTSHSRLSLPQGLVFINSQFYPSHNVPDFSKTSQVDQFLTLNLWAQI